jgi:hypothetical protein
MAKRPPLADLPVVTNEMSFSQFSFAEPEIMSQKEKKRKHPFQCTDNSKCDSTDNDEQVTCMMCHSVLNSLSLSERSAHVNRCLDETSGSKVNSSKSRKSPKKRPKDTDENDIASIFSPGSSSSLITATSRSRNVKRANNETSRKIVNLTREKNVSSSGLITLTEGKEHVEHSSHRSLSVDLQYGFQNMTESVGDELHRISATSTLQRTLKDSSNRPLVPMNLNPVRNGNTGVHSNLNMSAEELELFHLRLQLGRQALYSKSANVISLTVLSVYSSLHPSPRMCMFCFLSFSFLSSPRCLLIGLTSHTANPSQAYNANIQIILLNCAYLLQYESFFSNLDVLFR